VRCADIFAVFCAVCRWCDVGNSSPTERPHSKSRLEWSDMREVGAVAAEQAVFDLVQGPTGLRLRLVEEGWITWQVCRVLVISHVSMLNYVDYGVKGEDRIALVKAQRERERERENAEKEYQVIIG
jgi:hypothetical protein